MAGNQPLFASERRSSSTSEERAAREDDALLGNQREDSEASAPAFRSQHRFWREVGLFTWALLSTAAVIVLAVLFQHQHQSPSKGGVVKKPTGKRNLIFMVSDGSMCIIQALFHSVQVAVQAVSLSLRAPASQDLLLRFYVEIFILNRTVKLLTMSSFSGSSKSVSYQELSTISRQSTNRRYSYPRPKLHREFTNTLKFQSCYRFCCWCHRLLMWQKEL